MSKSLGYNFDKALIKSGHYYPRGFSEIDDEQTIIRRGLANLFSKKPPFFPVWIVNAPQPQPIDKNGVQEEDKTSAG
jgi:hypothetical protein